MFESDRIPIEALSDARQDKHSQRWRGTARVDGQCCFIKKSSTVSAAVQCAVDELKKEVGLPPIGVSRTRTTATGQLPGLESGKEVLVMRFHKHESTLEHTEPTPERIKQVSRILLFDVWLLNNDRTSGNFLILESGDLLPIDESAAFKCEATFRLDGKWRQALNTEWSRRPAEKWDYIERVEHVPTGRVQQILSRCEVRGAAATMDRLRFRALHLRTLWAMYVQAAESVR
jgi:hypothetical protein